MKTRAEIEKRVKEAFIGFQRGKSREAMIQLLVNDIEKYGQKLLSKTEGSKAASVSVENISDEFSKAAQEVESDWDMSSFSGTIYEEYAREVFNRYMENANKQN